MGATDIVLYVGREHTGARRRLAQALAEREADPNVDVQLVAAPVGYVAGEATAVVDYLNEGDARPTFLDARPHERGVAGRPTLAQNVESLAHAAVIARFGDDWYRSAGRQGTRGSALITVSGVTDRKTVHEIEYGTTIGEVAQMSGGAPTGGMVLPGLLRQLGPVRRGGGRAAGPRVDASAWVGVRVRRVVVHRIRRLRRGCHGRDHHVYGRSHRRAMRPVRLRPGGIAQAVRRLADGAARGDELARIGRWAGQVEGRGACRRPTAPWPAPQRAPGFRRGFRQPPAPPLVHVRACRRGLTWHRPCA